jgi:hypothetical protein
VNGQAPGRPPDRQATPDRVEKLRLRSGPRLGQNEFQTGLAPRGNVKGRPRYPGRGLRRHRALATRLHHIRPHSAHGGLTPEDVQLNP